MEERFKELRKYLNMTQKEFAKSLGIGQSTWAMIEVGKRELKERHQILICSIYKVRKDWLLNGTGEMFENAADKLSAYLAEIPVSDDYFIRDFIEVYMELDKHYKDVLRDIAEKMYEKRKSREI
ncbi:helix-turn-helix transcriptional regulator [Lachnospiraceae bacterium NSJ-143]|nr:helix-turn-helix transcriptional regulator [Lachnospiraceae bacterium NSJ-143]